MDLLRDEENRYCADCEAKGPRWASWNMGVFVCIRCAGIHRKLGVHISKVKSINLDSWTPEQVSHSLSYFYWATTHCIAGVRAGAINVRHGQQRCESCI